MQVAPGRSIRVDGIPEDVRPAILSFAGDVLQGEHVGVASLHVTGSVLTEDHVPGRTGVELVLVLESVDPGALERLASLGTKYGSRRLAVPLVFTRDEIARALDAFPIEFLNLGSNHRTIHGDDDLSSLRIDREPLRLQVERELRAYVQQLRQRYLSDRSDRALLQGMLVAAFEAYLPVLRALVHLETGTTPRGSVPTLRAAESALATSLGPLKDLWGIARSGRRAPVPELLEIFQAFHVLAEWLVVRVDRDAR